MPKRLSSWCRKIQAYRWLAGFALIARLPQGGSPPPPDQTQNTVGIVIVLLAVGLPILMGAGLAFVIWLVSLGTPTPLVAVERKKIIKREILPEGVHMPPPSGRPLVVAAGVTLICAGLLLRSIAISITPDFNLPIILVLGVLITFFGLVGWIRDDLRAAKEH